MDVLFSNALQQPNDDQRPATNLYMHKNHQQINLLQYYSKQGFNNVVLPTLFTVVNSIVQHCYT